MFVRQCIEGQAVPENTQLCLARRASSGGVVARCFSRSNLGSSFGPRRIGPTPRGKWERCRRGTRTSHAGTRRDGPILDVCPKPKENFSRRNPHQGHRRWIIQWRRTVVLTLLWWRKARFRSLSGSRPHHRQ